MAAANTRNQSTIVGATRTLAQARGDAAEALAAAHLEAHGVRMLARNVRCRAGEIDLIGLDRDTVVFVEVRQRSNTRFGGAAESITTRKQGRIILAARWWLAGSGRCWAAHQLRFDAILVQGSEPPALHWLRAAFSADGW